MTRLAARRVRSDDDDSAVGTLYILHGFFGAGRNWASFARRLVELRPDWSAVLVDLRLHGDSRDLEGPHTMAAAADDVVALHEALREEGSVTAAPALIGHSFGGKVALEVTARLAPVPVQTWVIDSTPAAGGRGGSADRMLARLEASPSSFPDRDAAASWIAAGGFDEATARWMATNLERRGERWFWSLDDRGLRELLDDFAATDSWPVLESPPAASDIHFVRASTGSILAREHVERIHALIARGAPVALHELEGGHWLHVDNPDGLLALVADRLPRVQVP